VFFFQAEDGIRYRNVTGVQTCALPIYGAAHVGAILCHSLLQVFGWHLEVLGVEECAQRGAAAWLHDEDLLEQLVNHGAHSVAARSEERRGGEERRTQVAPDN